MTSNEPKVKQIFKPRGTAVKYDLFFWFFYIFFIFLGSYEKYLNAGVSLW